MSANKFLLRHDELEGNPPGNGEDWPGMPGIPLARTAAPKPHPDQEPMVEASRATCTKPSHR